jgi:hypothetical protein
MDRTTVFTKTAKGITQVNQKSASLSKDLMKVLKLVDGKSNFGQLMDRAALDKSSLEKALNTLTKDGFARVFQVRKEEADPFAGEDEFDFTAPGKMPASTQRVVPGAANDISELARQQEKIENDAKARVQAQEAARAKAKTEAESRAKLEAEAKARAEVEQLAMEQAQRAREAAERAKAELEAKMREEEARKKSLAEQQARLTAEQRAKEEAEQRRLAEVRVRAEQEAKALAEARARAEAEAQALAKARADAEAAAKKQAAVASNAEHEMRARLKEEIEARIRGEMEQLLRNELEEKTRAEMQAQILEEAKLAARAELEERLREERESLAKAEMEARRQAESAARARAEQEAKLRAEAEARARAETEARMKAEEEARLLRIRADRAAQEAEAAARGQQEAAQRLEAERRAKFEAEARVKIEAEERERREAELQATLEEERKAKQEAEMRARIEARARETIAEDTRAKVQAEIENDMAKRAEIEGKAQAKAYMDAKVKAERDEDERMRQEQARRAREIADVLRTRVEPDEPAKAKKSTRRRTARKGSFIKTAFYSLAALVIVAVIALHVVPLRFYAAKIEREMSAWLHDDVTIASLTFRLVPTPHLRIENLAVGKLLDAKAATGRIYMDIGTLFADKPAITEIDLDNVTVSSEAVKRIPTWGRADGKAGAGGIAFVRLRGVKLDVKPALDPFDADLSFARDGRLNDARLAGPGAKWRLDLKPGTDGTAVGFTASNWVLPVGAPIAVSDVTMKGTWSGSEIVVPEFEGSALEGRVNGTLRASWISGGAIHLDSNLSLAKVNASALVSSFTKDIAVTGRLDGNFTLSAEGPDLETLFAAPRVQGKFRLVEGSVSNVDLVAVMQSDTAGQRAGVTKFAELTGEYGAADQRSAFRQVSLQGGVLRGSGAVDVGANSNIAGHLQLEIRSQVAQDRGAFNVSGTISRPIIRRGG